MHLPHEELDGSKKLLVHDDPDFVTPVLRQNQSVDLENHPTHPTRIIVWYTWGCSELEGYVWGARHTRGVPLVVDYLKCKVVFLFRFCEGSFDAHNQRSLRVLSRQPLGIDVSELAQDVELATNVPCGAVGQQSKIEFHAVPASSLAQRARAAFLAISTRRSEVSFSARAILLLPVAFRMSLFSTRLTPSW